MTSRQLILASSSRYRKELLSRLQIPFTTASPSIDESRLENETPQQLVTRLSKCKANALAATYPGALIIGSDQVAVCNDKILGKSGTRENAIFQLQHCNGRSVFFYTGLCVLDTLQGQNDVSFDIFEVKFRSLSPDQIERYVDAERPFDSAGSFKAESLGIALFEYMKGDDPTSLIGLPLIKLTHVLNQFGIQLP